MYSVIQGVIKEYLLKYYAKCEDAECQLLYKDDMPYILCGSKLCIMEKSLANSKGGQLIIQNILELWGVENKLIVGYSDRYYIEVQNNDKIIVELTIGIMKWQTVAFIGSFPLYDFERHPDIQRQLLALLFEPLLFFENMEGKQLGMSAAKFFDVYKCCIFNTVSTYIHSHTCKYMMFQLIIDQYYIAHDMFVIVMNMYIEVFANKLLRKLLVSL